jgi:aminopeptidase
MQEAYARLVIEQGINLQPDQPVYIKAEWPHRAFVHLLTRTAYERGAKLVEVDWIDTSLIQIRVNQSGPDHLAYVPAHAVQRGEELVDQGYAYIAVTGAEDPDAFSSLDTGRLQSLMRAQAQAARSWRAKMMANQIPWTVCGVPTPGWARKVFPDLSEAEGMERLWQAIFAASRADQPDPAAAWAEHQQKLQAVVHFLHDHQVRTLHFVDPVPGPDGAPRTDLTIGLTDRPKWITGGSVTQAGRPFSPNIPTEEAFCTPHRLRVNGYARTSMPFYMLARPVKQALFRFEEGQVVSFEAGEDQAVLEQFFSVEGTRHLGEVALVDVTSPIFQSGLLFHDTLYDENAASHIAFGKAYPDCVEGHEAMSEEDLLAFGVNDSLLHQDVMIGTPTMNITATCADGSTVTVMGNGRYRIG